MPKRKPNYNNDGDKKPKAKPNFAANPPSPHYRCIACEKEFATQISCTAHLLRSLKCSDVIFNKEHVKNISEMERETSAAKLQMDTQLPVTRNLNNEMESASISQGLQGNETDDQTFPIDFNDHRSSDEENVDAEKGKKKTRQYVLQPMI